MATSIVGNRGRIGRYFRPNYLPSVTQLTHGQYRHGSCSRRRYNGPLICAPGSVFSRRRGKYHFPGEKCVSPVIPKRVVNFDHASLRVRSDIAVVGPRFFQQRYWGTLKRTFLLPVPFQPFLSILGPPEDVDDPYALQWSM